MHSRTGIWILEDQLSPAIGPLQRTDKDTPLLPIEPAVWSFAVDRQQRDTELHLKVAAAIWKWMRAYFIILLYKCVTGSSGTEDKKEAMFL